MAHRPTEPQASLLTNANCIDFARRRIEPCALLIERGVIARRIDRPALRLKGVRSIDLAGSYVIPGFIDGHTHLVPEGIEMQRLDLSRCRSLDECFRKISADIGKNEFVFASRWDETTWRRGRVTDLDRKALDQLSSTVPVIMRRVCGHCAVVNTAALRRIPEHWKIVDRKRGYLYEDVALNLNEIFVPGEDMLARAVRLATTKALRLGITSVHEISQPRYLRVLQRERNRLKVRFSIYLTEKHHEHAVQTGLRSGFGDDWLRFAGIKVFMDGSLGARTAALGQPYAGSRVRGNILVPISRLRRLVQRAEDHGIQLMIHSIGDRSTETTLRVLKDHISRQNPLRHRLEHLELLNRKSIDDIRRFNLIASMQPNFVRRWQHQGSLYDKVIGERYVGMNCFRSILESGARLVFGSDCMPLGPLYGIGGAVGHPSSCGRLDTAAAFRLYTETGAYAAFDEKKKGRLQPGYLADLVVFDKNPLEEKNLSRLKILAVMVGGEFGYVNGNFAVWKR